MAHINQHLSNFAQLVTSNAVSNSVSLSGNITFVSGVHFSSNLVLDSTTTFVANGEFGFESQALVSNGTGIYWKYIGDGYNGSIGTIGYTGSIGIGFAGSTGGTGYTGSAGYIGVDGYTGSIGADGYNGSFGEIGYTGSIGYGYTGSKGTTAINNYGTANTAGQILISNGTIAEFKSKFYVGDYDIIPISPEYGDIWFSTIDDKPFMWVNNGYYDLWYDFLPPRIQ